MYYLSCVIMHSQNKISKYLMSVAHMRTINSVTPFLSSAGSADDLSTVKPATSVNLGLMMLVGLHDFR